MTNYRDFAEVEAEYLRSHPDEIDDYINILFDEYQPEGRKNMNETTTTARMRPDGVLVEVLADGAERPIPTMPPRPMTEAEITAAASADRDALPMTETELQAARHR